MRFSSLALAAALIVVVGGTALADTMASPSPKPSGSAMHSNAMGGHMMGSPKPSAKPNAMHSNSMGGHMMGSPSPKPSMKP
jgi:hypothetical protein